MVEINPNSAPPVCKIIDYGKYKYLLQKKRNESKKHQIVVHLKEIQMRPNIDEHDIQFKIRHILRFLQEKDKVKVTIQFRGREMQHIERGQELANRVILEIKDHGVVDAPPKREGKTLSMILAPAK